MVSVRTLALFLLFVSPALGQFGAGRGAAGIGNRMPQVLVQSGTNSHYFVDPTGKAVYLVGSHTWNNFLDIGQNGSPAGFDFSQFVSFLTQHGMNATFLWRKELPVECGWQGFTWTQSPQPYARSATTGASDGGNKFDLTAFNQAYFDRLRARVQLLGNAGIYAIVQVFDGNNLTSTRCGNTSPSGDAYPYTATNNVNGVDDSYVSGTCGVASYTMTGANTITSFQDALAQKYVDTLADLPNVIWEIAEEQPGTSFSTGCSGYGGASTMTWWAGHMMGVIQAREAGKPYQHPIGIGAMNWNDRTGGDTTLYSSSMGWIAPTIATSIPQWPAIVATNNQSKIVLNDSDHSFGYQAILNADGSVNTSNTHGFVWENLTDGASGTFFMDPYLISITNTTPIRNTCTGATNGVCAGLDTKYENFRAELGASARYANQRLDLVKMTPQPGLSSTGHCLANNVAVGGEFLIYAPGGGTFTVNLSAQSGRLMNVEWFDPATNGVNSTTTYTATSSTAQSFTTPAGMTDAVLYIVDAAGHN
jgi:hypothetical protein